MSARILGKEKPARDGNPCGLGANFETCEEIMEHQTGYGKPKDNADYVAFLQEKTPIASFDGFDIEDSDIHPILKPHQRACVKWAVKGGNRALFEAFGLGKSVQQVEIVRIIMALAGGLGLIVCPLGVRQEFRRDAAMLGVETQFIRRTDEINPEFKGIYLTNYESVRDGRLDPRLFAVVSLDEASILRSYGSKTFQEFLPLFEGVKHKFVATATPSPNRYKELIHYAGFLGVMDTGQALAQPLTSKVLTPTGWVQMGDIKPGDKVIGRNGKATAVLGVYPQGEKEIFRVAFSDGTSTRCTAEHLWLTRTQYQRNAATKFSQRNPGANASSYWTVKETAEIAGTLICDSTGSKNHQVPLVDVVMFDPQPVDVDPWLLGFVIGDGCLRETSVTISTADEWIVERAREAVARYGLSVSKIEHVRADGQPNYDYSISGGQEGKRGRGNHSNAVLHGLREYGLLGKRAWEKRIPSQYLFNTPEVRLATLQGLMDADGTVAAHAKNRTTRLCTTSQGLADDAMFIARSLGGTATVAERKGRTPTGGEGRAQYIVTMRLPNGTIPFQLPRKVDLVVKREKYKPVRYITSVERDGSEPAQCIAVEDDDHLYVTDDFIVTHNTRFFQRDSTQANNLTLYPHKEREFWMWLNSWAIFLQTPSDLGFSDEGYDLPEITVHYHEVRTDILSGGEEKDGQAILFKDSALGLRAASAEKRDSLDNRISEMVRIIESHPDDHIILWHDLEAERLAIQKAVPDAVAIYGSQDLDEREQKIVSFSDGEFQYLSAKPVIAGSGCNFQRHCHRAIFLGVGYKFNDFIQAVHRIQRFQQEFPVEIHLIYSEAEREILKTLETKWAQHKKMVANMTEIIKEHGLNALSMSDILTRSIGVERIESSGRLYTVANNDCVVEARIQPENHCDLIVTSIPFSNHYEYTPSYNDFGHTDSNDHFWRQMDFLTPELLRILRPGRIYCCHVKDRILFGNVTGAGAPTVSPFHAEALFHGIKHGFDYMGMITVVTDVVRENNQTYRLGWSEQCKDGTKMGVGSPEYILIFRKPQSDRTKGYADAPVKKSKAEYTRAQWQVDAHAFWRSSGNRLLTAEDLAGMGPDKLARAFTEYTMSHIYDYEHHIKIGKDLELRGALPSSFMSMAPGSHVADVWHDVNRMQTLNGDQTARGLQNHVCPLQIDIVDRLINRYSNPGELVYDPFCGLGTVPYRAIKLGRKGQGSELNTGYFFDSLQYLKAMEQEVSMPGLFDALEMEEAST